MKYFFTHTIVLNASRDRISSLIFKTVRATKTKHNSLYLARTYLKVFLLETVRFSKQTKCPSTNIRAYFRAKWRPMSFKICPNESKENARIQTQILVHFTLHARLGKGGTFGTKYKGRVVQSLYQSSSQQLQKR